jgi:hypothetical protein
LATPPSGPFPRTYRIVGFWRYFAVLFGGIMLLAMPLIIYSALTLPKATFATEIVMSVILLTGLLAVICMAVAPFRQRVTLTGDAIIAVGIVGERQLRYADIAGKNSGTAARLVQVLIPKKDCGKPLSFDLSYNFDQPFKDWFDSIPEYKS